MNPPLLTVNSIHVDLSRDDIRVIPAIADPVSQVQGLPDIAARFVIHMHAALLF